MATEDSLGRCDTVVIRSPVSDPALEHALNQSGFQRDAILLKDQVDDAPNWEKHVYGYNRYGPYGVYRRAQAH